MRVWDADTGQPIGQPMTGHTDTVDERGVQPRRHPDRLRQCSTTPCGCGTPSTGQPIGQPLTGHTDRGGQRGVQPRRHRIVSGSADNTVRLWDADTGQPVGQPLTGHTDVVSSVAFSPDGTRIVSGSGDKTVRLWDADTGQPIGQPLTGHTAGCSAWRSAPTASASPPAVGTRPCGCGTPTPANRSATR